MDKLINSGEAPPITSINQVTTPTSTYTFNPNNTVNITSNAQLSNQEIAKTVSVLFSGNSNLSQININNNFTAVKSGGNITITGIGKDQLADFTSRIKQEGLVSSGNGVLSIGISATDYNCTINQDGTISVSGSSGVISSLMNDFIKSNLKTNATFTDSNNNLFYMNYDSNKSLYSLSANNGISSAITQQIQSSTLNYLISQTNLNPAINYNIFGTNYNSYWGLNTSLTTGINPALYYSLFLSCGGDFGKFFALFDAIGAFYEGGTLVCAI